MNLFANTQLDVIRWGIKTTSGKRSIPSFEEQWRPPKSSSTSKILKDLTTSVLNGEIEDVALRIAAVGVVGGVVVVDVAVNRTDGAVEAHLQLSQEVPEKQDHVMFYHRDEDFTRVSPRFHKGNITRIWRVCPTWVTVAFGFPKLLIDNSHTLKTDLLVCDLTISKVFWCYMNQPWLMNSSLTCPGRRGTGSWRWSGSRTCRPGPSE